MHKFVSQNFEITPFSRSSIPTTSSAALYGKGIFTTIAISNEEPFLWDKHWRRLNQNAFEVGIDLTGFTEKKVAGSLSELIAANRVVNARARISFFDSALSSVWFKNADPSTTLAIQTADSRNLPDVLRLTVSPFPIYSKYRFANVKSCNYLDHIRALENAKNSGFDEAVRLNEHGEVATSCLANIFWLKNENLFSPGLESGCLAGTTREFIFEIANQNGFHVSESNAKLQDFLKADEVFLTSSGLSVASVGNIDDRKYPNDVAKKFQSMVQSSTNAKKKQRW